MVLIYCRRGLYTPVLRVQCSECPISRLAKPFHEVLALNMTMMYLCAGNLIAGDCKQLQAEVDLRTKPTFQFNVLTDW